MKLFRRVSLSILSAAMAASLGMTAVRAEENAVTVTGEEAMELAEVPAAVKDIIKVEDTTVTIDGADAWTDLNVGTPGNLELADNNYVTGWSYYYMMELTSWVKQLEKALEGTEVTSIHYNGTDTVIDKAYLDDLNELLDKLNSFDRSLKIRYDFEKTTSNYIAENGSAQLKFHVQTNGYWGYDLAGDSIIDKVTGEPGGYMENQQLNNKYANFFVVDMTEKFENMYVLNDTDLQNPVLYMNDKEAFLVDVDFRGGETLHKLVMDMVGDRDLYIYITHAHGDHYNNLEFFEAEDMKGLYFGKNEALPRAEWFAKFNDLVIPFEDGMKIERAGKEFEVIEMNNHTSGGSQLLDITDRILLSGDTIGAQTFKGGTTVGLSAVDNWIAQFDHSIEVLKLGTDERRCDYIIGGHTAYLNTWEFEMWVYQALLEAQEKGPSATTLNPIGQNTIVVRDGKVLSAEENLACFLNGTPVPAISDEEVMHTASINVRNDSIVTKDEKYPNVYHYTTKRVTDEYSENFYNAAYIIYADGALTEAKASKLLKDLGADANMEKYGWNALVVAPLGEEYTEDDLKLYTDALIDMSGSMFGLKIVGVGKGADFVNEYITQKDFAVSGYLTIDAENEGEYGDIPAYVTATEKETLAEAFANGWKEALSKTMKLGNIGATFYTQPASKERPYEFVPWTESEVLGFTRNVVKEDLDGDGADSLWYEYIPATASKEEGSAPMVLLLHGNTNDPRTQFETSGWAQLAAEEGIILIEPEWQGTSWGADPMTENDSTTRENDIITMLEKVFEKYPQIDQSRVYVEGLSRGSLNTMDLLLTHPEIFACGGSHSGAVIGDLMSADDFKDIIAEEKDQYDMPWFFIAGTKDNFVPVSERGAENSGILQALNLFEELNEMGHTEYADLDESKVEWFGFTQMEDFGEVPNSGSLTVRGGTIKNDAGIPMLSFNAVENWGHWNYPASAELMWSFFRQFSRDTETGELIYASAVDELNAKLAELPDTLLYSEDIAADYHALLDLKAEYDALSEAEKAKVDFTKAEELLNPNSTTLDPSNLEKGDSLEGLVIGYLGSSITQGFRSNGIAFPEYIAQISGSTAIKQAIPGGTLALKEGYREEVCYINQLLNGALKDVEHLDALVVQLSTNDVGAGIPIGELSESFASADQDYRTIIGAMEFINAYAREKWNCPVMYYINAYLSDEYIEDFAKGDEGTEKVLHEQYQDMYEQMIDALYKVADKWDLGVADLWNDEYVRSTDLDLRYFFMDDPIHPHKAGYWFWYVQPIMDKLAEITSEQALTLNKTEAEMPTRTTLQLSASEPVTWTSSDEKIATVDENGLVTALRYGKVTITATAEDGETVTCEIQTRYYDVNDDSKYYYKPVYWAADKAITKGYDNVYFGPQNNCTREAVVTFLWRLAGKPEPKSTKNPFKDVQSGKYYYKAVLWAAEQGITKGYSDGTFRPDDTCLREHVVTFLYRYAGSPSVKPVSNPFNDVKLSDYYYRAAVWANQNGIAKGYSEGEHAGGFGPKLDCLREHVVTFLYRYAN